MRTVPARFGNLPRGSVSIFAPRTNSIVSTRLLDSSSITCGNETSRVRGEVRAEPRVVRRLEQQIGLIVDRLDEVPRVIDRIVRAQAREQRGHAREHDQDRGVALDLAAHAGPEHLHGDLAAVGEPRAMDLRDAGRSDRPLVEFDEHVADRLAEIGFDRLADAAEPERRQPVLEQAELVDDLGGEQSRAACSSPGRA